MNRYKIAINNEEFPERRLFHFPASQTMGRTLKYIKHCINKDGIFIADNIAEDALNGAIIEISKLLDAPILVETEKEAQLFSISYSYRNIFPKNQMPKGQYFILYNCLEKDLEKKIQPIISIFSTKESIQVLRDLE